jgi:hypothetical protein
MDQRTLVAIPNCTKKVDWCSVPSIYLELNAIRVTPLCIIPNISLFAMLRTKLKCNLIRL